MGHSKSTFVEDGMGGGGWGGGGGGHWKANKNEQGEGGPSMCAHSLF